MKFRLKCIYINLSTFKQYIRNTDKWKLSDKGMEFILSDEYLYNDINIAFIKADYYNPNSKHYYYEVIEER